MPYSRGRFLPETPGRAMVLAGAVLILSMLFLAGCTQPVIPSPVPQQTTPATAATTQAPAATTVATVQVTKGADYVTYTNPQYGFSISYPVGWVKAEGAGGSVVAFTAPSSGMGDIPASMKVLVEDLTSNPMSLEQYKSAQLAKKQGLDRFNTILDLPYKGPGFSGWKVGYSYDSGTIMKTFDLYAIRGNTAYTVTFTARDDRLAGVSVPMDVMFKSFTLNT